MKKKKNLTSAEDFSSQVDMMTCSVDSKQPQSLSSHSLSSATPIIAQWIHERHGHGGRDGGYAKPQQYGLLT